MDVKNIKFAPRITPAAEREAQKKLYAAAFRVMLKSIEADEHHLSGVQKHELIMEGVMKPGIGYID